MATVLFTLSLKKPSNLVICLVFFLNIKYFLESGQNVSVLEQLS